MDPKKKDSIPEENDLIAVPVKEWKKLQRLRKSVSYAFGATVAVALTILIVMFVPKQLDRISAAFDKSNDRISGVSDSLQSPADTSTSTEQSSEANTTPEKSESTSSKRPATGDLAFSLYGEGSAALKLEVSSQSQLDYYFALTLPGYNVYVSTVYVRRGESITLNTVPGTYDLYYADGMYWDNTANLFGKGTELIKVSNAVSLTDNDPQTFTVGEKKGEHITLLGSSCKKFPAPATAEQVPAHPPVPEQGYSASPGTTSTESKKPVALSRPATGSMVRSPSDDGLAPLTVITEAGKDYLIALTPVYSNEAEMMFYVRGGIQTEVDVPLGDYYLFYATGTDWYGEDDLFGPDTQRYKCDDIFPFEEDDDGYTGWTVELYLQTNGNLDSFPVTEDSFPS